MAVVEEAAVPPGTGAGLNVVAGEVEGGGRGVLGRLTLCPVVLRPDHSVVV